MVNEGMGIFSGSKLRFDCPEEAIAFWRSRQGFLAAQGYVLLNPEKPVEGIVVENHFEHYGTDRPKPPLYDLLSTVNATRVADGREVCIKRVGSSSDELLKLTSFSSGLDGADPGNRCVPIYHTILDSEHEEISYIVMPALRSVGPSTMRTVGELVELVSQVLLGLNFLHRRRLAHCDCSLHNIMLSEEPTRDVSVDLSTVALSRVWPLSKHRPALQPTTSAAKVYFVGFGSATPWDPRYPNSTTLQSARDREPPEFHNPNTRCHNPLLLDIFLIGNMFRRMFLDKYSNVGFLKRLIKDMIQPKPVDRIDSKEALRLWYELLPQISSLHRRQTLRTWKGWQTNLHRMHTRISVTLR